MLLRFQPELLWQLLHRRLCLLLPVKELQLEGVAALAHRRPQLQELAALAQRRSQTPKVLAQGGIDAQQVLPWGSIFMIEQM
jgi:hypothetical protein